MVKKKKKNKSVKKPKKLRRELLRCDAILFDIDNVLINTRHSYLDAIRHTIDIYLTEGKIPLFINDFKSRKEKLLTTEDIHQFKLLGGFNDDWDCCNGLLIYLLSLKVKKRTLSELKKVMNIRKLSKKIKTRPLGSTQLVKMFGRPKAVMIEKISRIFQEIYLGRNLFKAVEGKSASFWNRSGLMEKEKLIFKKRQLQKLKESGFRLGIATGRPRFEALYALKHFEIDGLFDSLTVMDDVKRAEREMKRSLRKPHPHSLIETAKKIGKGLTFVYVGDLPDDVAAANAAKATINIHSIAFPTYGSHDAHALAEIEKMQPDFLIQKPSDLFRIIRPKK